MERNPSAGELNSARVRSASTWAFVPALVAGAVILLLNSLGPGSGAAVLIGAGLTVAGVVGFLRSPGTDHEAGEKADAAER